MILNKAKEARGNSLNCWLKYRRSQRARSRRSSRSEPEHLEPETSLALKTDILLMRRMDAAFAVSTEEERGREKGESEGQAALSPFPAGVG
jgi:hypothetical protein